MKFEQPLVEGTLIRRQSKYLADVKLKTGQEIIVHCANPGSMKGCSEPGSRVLLSTIRDPRLKLEHQLEIIYAGRTPVGVHRGRPIGVVTEAIMGGLVTELAGYATLKRDPKGRKGLLRADLILEGNGLRPCSVLVENVTLAHDNIAYYPDAPSPASIEELQRLTDVVREGGRGMVFCLAQRGDVDTMKPADHIDPEFGQAFRDAVARGVEIIAYNAKVSRKGIEIDSRMKVELTT